MAPTSTTTARMSAEERRRQLLDVTRTIVAERGFHAVSIEAVAREAGITRPVVYGHFTDLAGLLEALVDQESERALGQLAAVLPHDLAAGDPRELLLGALRGYLEAVQAEPVTWRLVLMPPEGAPAILRDRIAHGRAAVVDAARAGDEPGPRRGARVARPRADRPHAVGAGRRGRAPAPHGSRSATRRSA